MFSRPLGAGLLIAIVIAAATFVESLAFLESRSQPAQARIARLDWLAGEWRGTAGPVSFEEHWMTPAGGAMLAVSRTIKGERMVAFEFLRIIERQGSLVYIAQPNGHPPTEFVLTGIDAASATFENPQHDFPKAIRYTKRSDGMLEARVSDGGERAETFVFHRAP